MTESATTNVNPETSPEGHNEAMMELADQQEQVGTGTETVSEDSPEVAPDKILGKFNSQEDLEKGYKELEVEYTRLKMEGSQQQQEKETPQEEETSQSAQEFVEGKGLDYSSFENEVAETGQLSLESLAQLKEAGISPEVAQQYVQNQNSYIDSMRKTAFSLAGSEENYNAMTQWAENSLSEGAKNAFNDAVTSGDQDKAQQAIESLAFQYQNQYGNPPERQISGKGGSSYTGYQSEAEMVSAMSDPRYQNDPAYRAEVGRKVASGSVFR